ncbi:MAG TPA: type I phosphomannose isomerase catalytic subunit [Opitutales bacterium]|nr:type I phosphomannose isomerase catalytic subunit [Opitutales bacterium]
MKAILFKPIYQERVWGGRKIGAELDRELPENKPIGESWEIVDREEAQSVTEAGLSLRELIERDPEAIMGPAWPAERPFPILVKWLDCREKLSLQVHPPKQIAAELGGEPKTENWYIASAEPGATLMAGLKKGVSKQDFAKALEKNALAPLVHRFEVTAGESIFIPSGRIHAIGGGNLILEIQQNSDTTYRVYDWGRVGLDGKPRQLHIEASLRSTDFEDYEPETLKPTGKPQVLAESEVFNLRKEVLKDGEKISFEGGSPLIISMLKGKLEGSEGSSLERGDNALLPACQSFQFTASEATEFLITSDFTR